MIYSRVQSLPKGSYLLCCLKFSFLVANSFPGLWLAEEVTHALMTPLRLRKHG
ncbi:unnamed protein product [Brassica rapa subsp. trilocularis]